MRFGEAGLVLLSLSAFAGLFVVISRAQTYQTVAEIMEPELSDPVLGLEADFASICYGSEFRLVPSAHGDTLVRSMDLRDGISIHQANLLLTRSLARHGFEHWITLYDPDQGISFHCITPDGQPARFDLFRTSR